jgi:hypothetical protein
MLVSANSPAEIRKAAASTAADSVVHTQDRTARSMTLSERLADMRAYGREICATPQSALDFLKRAGIVDASGRLAKPFRN